MSTKYFYEHRHLGREFIPYSDPNLERSAHLVNHSGGVGHLGKGIHSIASRCIAGPGTAHREHDQAGVCEAAPVLARGRGGAYSRAAGGAEETHDC